MHVRPSALVHTFRGSNWPLSRSIEPFAPLPSLLSPVRSMGVVTALMFFDRAIASAPKMFYTRASPMYVLDSVNSTFLTRLQERFLMKQNNYWAGIYYFPSVAWIWGEKIAFSCLLQAEERRLFYKGHLIRATFETSLAELWNLGPSLVLSSSLRATVYWISFSVTVF